MKTPTTSKRRLLQLLAALMAFAFLAAACGSDSDSDDTSDETTDESTDAGDDEETTTTTAAEETEDTTEDTTDEAADEDDAMESGNVVLVACGDGSSFATPDAPVTDLTVALVAPSASADLAFTQSMVDSLHALGIDPKVTDGTFIVEEAAAAIRGYAEEGIDVVIAHGTQYGGSLTEIAPDFPETAFLWGTSSDTQGLDNVFAYTPAADQGGYVLGTIAASMTESGTIGMVGPVEAGDAALYVDGFTAGAEAAGVDVSTTYTGSFGDVQLATEAAQAFVDTGADVLTGTAQHVVGAINVATTEGIPWFGTQSNQTSLAEDLVVASQVYHWEGALADIFTKVEGGTLGGEVYEINLENNGLVIEFNGCNDAVTDEMMAAAQDTVDGIVAGDITTGA
jgi:basic membrane lipoprotein Med (substrate-binding protein (PBP1-ABC) superfamily)